MKNKLTLRLLATIFLFSFFTTSSFAGSFPTQEEENINFQRIDFQRVD